MISQGQSDIKEGMVRKYSKNICILNHVLLYRIVSSVGFNKDKIKY